MSHSGLLTFGRNPVVFSLELDKTNQTYLSQGGFV